MVKKMEEKKTIMTTFEALLLGIFAFSLAPLLAYIVGLFYNYGPGLSFSKAIVYGIGFAIGATLGSGLYRLLKYRFPQTIQRIDSYLVFEDKNKK